jgi:hypothetical protein
MAANSLCPCILVCAISVSQAQAAIPRVRGTDPAVSALVEQAKTSSATFRSLVDVIDRTDGLVYVDNGTCPGRIKACLMHSVTLAGPNRLLRVKIDVRRSDGELIALLGHELQHAIEILSNPGLRNNAEVLTFYQQAGIFGGGNAVETQAALAVQQKIRVEVREAGKASVK